MYNTTVIANAHMFIAVTICSNAELADMHLTHVLWS